MRLREDFPLIRRALGNETTYLQKGPRNLCEKKDKDFNFCFWRFKVREICWIGPNPGTGKRNEVPEVELTRLKMLLSRPRGLWGRTCCGPKYMGLRVPCHSGQLCDMMSEPVL